MRTFGISFGSLVFAVVLAACGSSGSGNGGDGSGSTSGSGSSGGTSSGSSGGSSSGGSGSSGGSSGGSSSSGSSGGSSSGGGGLADASLMDGSGVSMNPDTGAGTESYTVQFGPVSVGPGVENTQCLVLRLGNPNPIHVGKIHDLLGTSSHHMIVYKVSDTTEQKTPFNCTPFQDTLNPAAGNPLIISQKADDTLTLPDGAAFTLDANQMIRLEMHYINANPTQTVTLTSTATLSTISDTSYKYDASFLFIGDLSISIPANSTYSTGKVYFPLPANYDTSNFFAITGHEHHLGTNVTVWTANSATDPGTQVYQSTSWSDPPVTMYTPPMNIAASGGFTFQCDWNNTTALPVSFGESANNEMCFFWAYYYPSQGASVCFVQNGSSACCPGTSPLCSVLSTL